MNKTSIWVLGLAVLSLLAQAPRMEGFLNQKGVSRCGKRNRSPIGSGRTLRDIGKARVQPQQLPRHAGIARTRRLFQNPLILRDVLWQGSAPAGSRFTKTAQFF